MSLFGKKKKPSGHENAKVFELVTERGNGYYTWNGKLFESDVVRSCIRPKANAIGKLAIKHLRDEKVFPDAYLERLLKNPNPIMSMQQMLVKLANQLCINNNAFALVIRGDAGLPVAIYPITATSAEAVWKDGNLFLRFFLKNGKIAIYPYGDVIHLRQCFCDGDVFGESPARAITPLMEIISTTDQGLVNAVKNSGVIKWLLKVPKALHIDDIEKRAKAFAKSFLSVESESMGVAATDATAEAQQIEPKDYVPNASIMGSNKQRLYDIFGTNEKIVQSKADGDEWNSYYESEVEPVVLDIANEFTTKVLTQRQQARGERILAEAANLQCISTKSKLEFVAMVDRGALTPNEWREIFNLAPVPGGDQPIRRLDTPVVE